MKKKYAIRKLKVGQRFRFKQPCGLYSGIMKVLYIGKIVIKFQNREGQIHSVVKSLFDLTTIKRPGE